MSFLSPALTLLEKIITSRTDAPCGAPRINYLEPPGDPGIFGPASVSWRVLSNPASVFIGGITPVFFGFGQPNGRAGGLGHTKFFTHPVGRLRKNRPSATVITY